MEDGAECANSSSTSSGVGSRSRRISPSAMARSASGRRPVVVRYLKGISRVAFLKRARQGRSRAVGSDHYPSQGIGRRARRLAQMRSPDEIYVWVDGIRLQVRSEDRKQCILVLIGATREGSKELVGFTNGAREMARSAARSEAAGSWGPQHLQPLALDLSPRSGEFDIICD
jgi:putative transposase